MTTWYEKAEDQIDRDLAEGLIDQKEYQAQMRDLRNELSAEAEDAAASAYADVMGGY